MALTIIRKKDQRIVRAFTHRLADIANGVNIATADFTQTLLREGTPVGKDTNGLYHIVKTSEVAVNAGSDATTYVVKKGHNFKTGYVIFAKVGGKAYAITSIANDASHEGCDILTVGTTLGVAITAGDVVAEAKSAGASAGAFKYIPVGLVGENYDVDALTNRPANVVTIGQATKSCMPALGFVADSLKGIIIV